MDINKAEKLLQRYLDRTCTIEEKRLVESWYDKMLINQMHDSDPVEDRFVDRELRERLKEYVYDRKLKRKAHYLHTWSAVAAVLLVFSGIYIYTQRYNTLSPNEFASPVRIDQESYVDGVTLKLADGETIQLKGDQAIVIDTSTLAYSDGSIVISENRIVEDSPILELSTPKGGQYQINLSDGSRVWLNASSSLKFPKEFKDSERRVELKGEAYFEIYSNESKPFKVITNFSSNGGQVVEVLGTKFNVDAYQEENAIKTTLLEGSVIVEVTRSASSKILEPKQQSIVRPESNIIATRKVNIENVIAWKRGDFVFDDEDLESIMHKVSRWYDIEVDYETEPKGLYFNGVISRSRDLSAVLEALEETGKIEFKIEGRKITVKQGKDLP